MKQIISYYEQIILIVDKILMMELSYHHVRIVAVSGMHQPCNSALRASSPWQLYFYFYFYSLSRQFVFVCCSLAAPDETRPYLPVLIIPESSFFRLFILLHSAFFPPCLPSIFVVLRLICFKYPNFKQGSLLNSSSPGLRTQSNCFRAADVYRYIEPSAPVLHKLIGTTGCASCQ